MQAFEELEEQVPSTPIILEEDEEAAPVGTAPAPLDQLGYPAPSDFIPAPAAGEGEGERVGEAEAEGEGEGEGAPASPPPRDNRGRHALLDCIPALAAGEAYSPAMVPAPRLLPGRGPASPDAASPQVAATPPAQGRAQVVGGMAAATPASQRPGASPPLGVLRRSPSQGSLHSAGGPSNSAARRAAAEEAEFDVAWDEASGISGWSSSSSAAKVRTFLDAASPADSGEVAALKRQLGFDPASPAPGLMGLPTAAAPATPAAVPAQAEADDPHDSPAAAGAALGEQVAGAELPKSRKRTRARSVPRHLGGSSSEASPDGIRSMCEAAQAATACNAANRAVARAAAATAAASAAAAEDIPLPHDHRLSISPESLARSYCGITWRG